MAVSSVVELSQAHRDLAQWRVAEHLGRRVRRRRRLMGLTQRDLAQASGLQFDDIQKCETAAVSISEAQLQRLASALMTPLSYFYFGLDQEPARPSR